MSLTLYFSPTSPYARKVRIALIELGLAHDVQEIPTNPFVAGPEYFAVNPLSKIPTLITHEGIAIPDSRLILDYLHSLNAALDRAQQGPNYWQTRRIQQYADGVIDAAVAANLEQRREAGQISQTWLSRHSGAISRTLDALNAQAHSLLLDGTITPAEISTAAALGYLDLRLPALQWRDGREALASWQRVFAERPSVRATEPA